MARCVPIVAELEHYVCKFEYVKKICTCNVTLKIQAWSELRGMEASQADVSVQKILVLFRQP